MAATSDIQQQEIWNQLEKEQQLADQDSSDFSDTPSIILIKVYLRLLSSSPKDRHEELRNKMNALIFRFCNSSHPLTTILLLHISE